MHDRKKSKFTISSQDGGENSFGTHSSYLDSSFGTEEIDSNELNQSEEGDVEIDINPRPYSFMEKPRNIIFMLTLFSYSSTSHQEINQ